MSEQGTDKNSLELAGRLMTPIGEMSGQVSLPEIVTKSLFGGHLAKRNVQMAASERLAEAIRTGTLQGISSGEREFLISIIYGESSKMARKMSILGQAEEYLALPPPLPPPPSEPPQEEDQTKRETQQTSDKKASPDIDWLLDFWSRCENVEDASMQQIFARILAGKVRDPESFPKAMLQTLSYMDRKAAEIFAAKIVPCTIAGSFMIDISMRYVGLTQSDLDTLDDIGLVHAVGACPYKFGGKGLETYTVFLGHNTTIVLHQPKQEFMHMILPLTGNGRRLFAVPKPPPDDLTLINAVAHWFLFNSKADFAIVRRTGEEEMTLRQDDESPNDA